MDILNNIDFSRLYPFILWLNEWAFSEVYFLLVYFSVCTFIFIYVNFWTMEKNGFNKENTLDTTFISLVVLICSLFLFYLYTGTVLISLYNGGVLFLIFFIYLFLYIKSKVSNWSFYKLLDIYAVSLSFLLFIVYLFLSFYFINYVYFLISILYLVLYKQFKKYIFGKSIKILFFIKLKKDETLSFIGGVGILFILYTLLIQLALYVYNFNTVNIVLILLIGLFIYFLIKRSRKNRVIWQFQMNLFQFKKLNWKKNNANLN